MSQQLDIIRDSPLALAQAWRQDAQTQLNNPYMTRKQREEWAKRAIAEAERLEAAAKARQ